MGSGHYIEGVPFVRQEEYFCGPASLSVIAGYHGKKLDQTKIAKEVFSQSLRGTLTLDIQLYAREHGYWSTVPQGNLEALRLWLDRSVPVIVLLQTGPRLLRQYHFVVLVGYHTERQVFLAHDGRRPNVGISFNSFNKRWKKAGRWALVMVPPDRITWRLDAAGHNDLGVFLERQDSAAEACQHYDKAIELDPATPLYYFNRGNLLFKLRRQEKSASTAFLEDYGKALELDPSFSDARNNLAYVLMTLGRLDEALAEAEEAVRVSGRKRYQYWETLAEVRAARREDPQALSAYERAIEESVAHSSAREKLQLSAAEVEMRMSQEGAARKRLRALLQSDPSDSARTRAQEILARLVKP